MLQRRIVAPEALPVPEGIRDQAPAALERMDSFEIREKRLAKPGRGDRNRGIGVRIIAQSRGLSSTAPDPIQDRCDKFPFYRSQRIGHLFRAGIAPCVEAALTQARSFQPE
jgi:hypothetical protein